MLIAFGTKFLYAIRNSVSPSQGSEPKTSSLKSYRFFGDKTPDRLLTTTKFNSSSSVVSPFLKGMLINLGESNRPNTEKFNGVAQPKS